MTHPGAAPEPDTRALLREQRRANALLQERIRGHQLERMAARYAPVTDQEAARLRKRLEEDVGWSYVGAYDEAFDRFSGPDRDLIQPISLYQDRRYGANWPFWRTWLEHARIRAGGRLIVGQGLFAGGVLEGLTDYVIATGYTDQALARSDECPDALVHAVQDCLDEFSKHNQWPLQQRELFFMSRRDGECFWRFEELDDGMLEVDQILPEQILEPPGCHPETEQFGIITEPGHILKVTGYSLCLDGDAAQAEIVDASEMVHIKINVDRMVKRGMSDFSFDTYDTLRGAGRLIDALSIGSAMQASIAFVRQHEQAVQSEVQGFVAANSDFGTPYPSAGTSPSTGTSRRYTPGTIEDIPKGLQYVATPFGTNAQNFVAVEEAVLRAVAVRWRAPEWLMAGTMNNANYASSVTAESPFVRACEAKQKLYGFGFQHTAERAVQCRCEAGRLRCLGRSWTWDEVKRLVEIKSEPPSLVVRNKLQEAQTDQIMMQAKVKSPQTVSQEQGLDYEQEQRNIQEHDEATGGQGQDLSVPGEDQPQGGGGNPLAALLGESRRRRVRETRDASGHEHGADGRFGGGGSAGNDDPDEYAEALEYLDDAEDALLADTTGEHAERLGSAQTPDQVKAAVGPYYQALSKLAATVRKGFDEAGVAELDHHVQPLMDDVHDAAKRLKARREAMEAEPSPKAKRRWERAVSGLETAMKAADDGIRKAGKRIIKDEREHIAAEQRSAHGTSAARAGHELGESRYPLRLVDAVLLEAGFTGVTKGRCYRDGKRVPCSQEHHAAVVDKAHGRIKGHLAQGALSHKDMHALAGHLLELTTDQLHALKRRLGLKASGSKFALASKLAEKALAGVRERKAGKGGPAKPPAKEPVAPPAKPEPPEPAPGPKGSHEERTYDAIARVMAGEPGLHGGTGTVIGMHVMKAARAAGLSKEDVETALGKLFDEDAIVLQAHNHPAILTPQERADLPYVRGTPISSIGVRDDDHAAVERMKKAMRATGSGGKAAPKPPEQAPAPAPEPKGGAKKEPPAPKADSGTGDHVAKEVNGLLDRAASVTKPEMEATLGKLDTMPKTGLMAVAKAIDMRVPAGISAGALRGQIREWVRGVVGGVGRTTMTNRDTPSAPKAPSKINVDIAHVSHAVQSLAKEHHGQIHLADLAQATGLSRDDLHDAIAEMHADGLVSLTPAEGRHGVSAKDQSHGIKDGDKILSFVSPREGGEQGLADLAKGHRGPAPEPAPAPKPPESQPAKPVGADPLADLQALHAASAHPDVNSDEGIARTVNSVFAPLGVGPAKKLAKDFGIAKPLASKQAAIDEVRKRIQGRAASLARSELGMGSAGAAERTRAAAEAVPGIMQNLERAKAVLAHHAGEPAAKPSEPPAPSSKGATPPHIEALASKAGALKHELAELGARVGRAPSAEAIGGAEAEADRRIGELGLDTMSKNDVYELTRALKLGFPRSMSREQLVGQVKHSIRTIMAMNLGMTQ